jgi:hypothetical protein
MSKLSQVVLESMANVPEQLLRRLVAQKLTAQDVDPVAELVDALTRHILNGEGGRFSWDGPGADREISLEFTAEDLEALGQWHRDLLESLPQTLISAVGATGESMARRLRNQWPTRRLLLEAQLDQFRGNLETRWAAGLEYLRLPLDCSRSLGEQTARRHARSRSPKRKSRRWILCQLHRRACQVTDEVICLLENGFAEGAFARWRTLHELSIVAMLIAEGDEDLAERYIAHDVVEVKRQADNYQQTRVPRGGAPIAPRRLKQIDKAYAKVLSVYGEAFRHPYGWAAKHLGHKKPTFAELQEHAQRTAASSHYKLASFGVHASARSLFFNLGSLLPEDDAVCARTNAGLAEPGCMTAYALVAIGGCYMVESTRLERTVEVGLLLCLRDRTEAAFRSSDRLLVREERQLRRVEASAPARPKAKSSSKIKELSG